MISSNISMLTSRDLDVTKNDSLTGYFIVVNRKRLNIATFSEFRLKLFPLLETSSFNDANGHQLDYSMFNCTLATEERKTLSKDLRLPNRVDGEVRSIPRSAIETKRDGTIFFAWVDRKRSHENKYLWRIFFFATCSNDVISPFYQWPTWFSWGAELSNEV